MQGTKEIKRRIKSVKSTKKITKAMELVAASKMKRAIASTLASREYAKYSWDVLTSLAQNVEEISHPLFVGREVKNILLILITSNRGLCGAYNAQVTKAALAFLKAENKMLNVDLLTVGKKGDNAMRRVGKKVIAAFTELPPNVSLLEVTPISKLVISEYEAKHYDKVLVAYTDFISGIVQKANIRQILPVSKTDLKELINNLGETRSHSSELEAERNQDSTSSRVNYLIEGEKNKLLASLAEKITKMQIYQMLLESNASEQSARMLAMKNASDAAGEMIDDLTLAFNKARQAGITQEISEISAGMASVS